MAFVHLLKGRGNTGARWYAAFHGRRARRARALRFEPLERRTLLDAAGGDVLPGGSSAVGTGQPEESTASLPGAATVEGQDIPTKVGQIFVVDDWDNKVTENDLGFNYFAGNAGALHEGQGATLVGVSDQSNGSDGGSLEVFYEFSETAQERDLAGYFASLFGLTDTPVSLDGSGQEPPAKTQFPGYFLDTQNVFGGFVPLAGRSVDELQFDIQLLESSQNEPVTLKIELKDEADATVYTRRMLTPGQGWQTITLSVPGELNQGDTAAFDWGAVSVGSLVIERKHEGDGVTNPDSARFLLDNLELIDVDGEYPDLSSIQDPVSGELDASYEEAFLDHIRSMSSLYFLDFASTDPRTGGIIQDRSTFADLMTVGGVGFQLSSYVINAARGYQPRGEAAGQVLDVLRVLKNNPQGPERVGTIGHQGFFYHFLGIDGLRKQKFDFEATLDTNEALNTVELSTIDTALAMAGVVTARQYFDGDDAVETEIRSLADDIYGRVDWRFMLNTEQGPKQDQFLLGWKPIEAREGAPFEIPDGNGEGHFSGTPGNPQTLDYYTDEALLTTLLAMGSPEPDHRVGKEVWDSLIRDDQGGPFIKTYPGSLFTYQFFSAWVDTGILGEDNYPSRPVDFFQNGRDAIHATIDYAAADPEGRATFANPHHWGLSAVEGPFDDYFAEAAPPAAIAEGWTDGGGSGTRLEGEGGTGQTANTARSNASGGQTALFTADGQVGTLSFDWDVARECRFAVRYSNDGPPDTIQISLDGVPVGDPFVTEDTRPPTGVPGSGWNEFVLTEPLGSVTVGAGAHELAVTVVDTDLYGVEIDFVRVDPIIPLEAGTVTNYGVGSSILHAPEEAIAALWNNARRDDLNNDGVPELLHPRFGFADGFNLDITDVASMDRGRTSRASPSIMVRC